MKRNHVITFKLDSMGEEGFYLLDRLKLANEKTIKPNGWMKLLVSSKDLEMLEWLCKLTNTPYEIWY